jgi:predicted DNA-binding mobile mystery protein A
MSTSRQIARQRLDALLEEVVVTPMPPRGWLRAIREALGMNTRDLAERMGVTQSRVSQIERAEEHGSIRLETLQRAAQALNCQLQYVLVPNEPLDVAVMRQARRRAEWEVATVTQTMALEDQAPTPEVIERHVRQLAEELVDHRMLWRSFD